MEYGKVTDKELESIRGIVGSERMSIGESVLDLHGKDESFHERRRPDVVVWPIRTEEISQILKMAHEKKDPSYPLGCWDKFRRKSHSSKGRDCP